VVNLRLAADTAISHKLTSVTDPTSAQDAATKKYVLAAPTGAMTKRERVLGTVYQPNTERTTFVIATIRLEGAGINSEGNILMDASNPPTTKIAPMQLAGSGIVMYFPVPFYVPASCYYKIEKALGSVTIISVYEYTL
jgi:hypothetical protein